MNKSIKLKKKKYLISDWIKSHHSLFVLLTVMIYFLFCCLMGFIHITFLSLPIIQLDTYLIIISFLQGFIDICILISAIMIVYQTLYLNSYFFALKRSTYFPLSIEELRQLDISSTLDYFHYTYKQFQYGIGKKKHYIKSSIEDIFQMLQNCDKLFPQTLLNIPANEIFSYHHIKQCGFDLDETIQIQSIKKTPNNNFIFYTNTITIFVTPLSIHLMSNCDMMEKEE